MRGRLVYVIGTWSLAGGVVRLSTATPCPSFPFLPLKRVSPLPPTASSSRRLRPSRRTSSYTSRIRRGRTPVTGLSDLVVVFGERDCKKDSRTISHADISSEDLRSNVSRTLPASTRAISFVDTIAISPLFVESRPTSWMSHWDRSLKNSTLRPCNSLSFPSNLHYERLKQD